MILDAGALIAVANNDRRMISRLVAAQEHGEDLKTHPMVVAQAWRDGRRQGTLARLLRAVQIIPIDNELGRRSGELLAKSKKHDPIDAAVVLIADDHEAVATSDEQDIRALAAAAKRPIVIIRC
jgi:hypothetical protein